MDEECLTADEVAGPWRSSRPTWSGTGSTEASCRRSVWAPGGSACGVGRSLTGAQSGARHALKRRNPRRYGGLHSTATGIRTRVSAVRGRRPSPLDDSGGTLSIRHASGSTDMSLAWLDGAHGCGPGGRRCHGPSGPDAYMCSCRAVAPIPQHLITSAIPRLWRNLVDAHGSGPCGLTPVEVRVLSAA